MTKEEIMAFDKDQLFDKDKVLEALGTEDRFEKEILLDAFLERSKDFKKYQMMRSLIKAATNEIKEVVNNGYRNQNNETNFGLTSELQCGSWIADDTGIYVLTQLGPKLACYHPIYPVERLCNLETGTEKITLAYRRGKSESWKEITVDKAVIASASKIVKLADYGIAVTSETAKALVQYLADVENLNLIPYRNSTSKFGWNGNEFIPIDKKVVFDDASRFRELANSLNPRGSYEIWLNLAREIRRNKAHYEPQVYMSAAFASVLLSKLNMLPFIVNLWGSTGKGKTVALMLACSIYADPAEGKYITDSYATQNAFEVRLDILNHYPLMMDDLSKVRDRMNGDFTDLIYLLCSGKGKDRSNIDLGLNKMKCWQNTILSNMERPLANETMKGGAINRILDFEMVDGYIFQNGNQVVEVLKDNYGWAGCKFIDLIKELPIETINAIRKDFEQQIKEEAKRQKKEKEEKQILPMSLLLTADKIATDYIFEDGIYLDLPTMVKQLKNTEDVSEGLRAYNAIMDYVKINMNRFTDANNNGEYWGFIKDNTIHIIPLIMRRIAEAQNFSPKAFCAWAVSKKLLEGQGGKNSKVVKIPGTEKTLRCYTLKMGYEPEDEEDENSANADSDGFTDVTEELPFD